MKIRSALIAMPLLILSAAFGAIISTVLHEHVAGAEAKKQKVLIAKAFVLVNAKGEPVGSMACGNDDKPYLALKNTSNKSSVTFLLGEKSAMISFNYPEDKSKLIIGMIDNNMPYILMNGANGNTINISPDNIHNTQNIEVRNVKGDFAGMGIQENNLSMVSVGNMTSSDQLAFVANHKDEGPTLCVMNKKTKRRITIQENQKYGGRIMIGPTASTQVKPDQQMPYNIAITSNKGESCVTLVEGDLNCGIELSKKLTGFGVAKISTNTGLFLRADENGVSNFIWTAMGKEVKTIP